MTERREMRPADFETADYRVVLRRLATLDEEAADHRAEALRWCDERIAAADEAIRQADQQIAAAGQAVAAAQRGREEVDARAAGLWSEYVHKVGSIAERYGRTVPPPAIPRQRGERNAEDLLDEVATKVKYIAPARPLTAGITLLCGLFGVVGGLVGVAAYWVLRYIGGGHAGPGGAAPAAGQGGTWRDALPVVALVVLLACPVLAVVAAKRLADRRNTGLDAATVATVLVSGLVTAGAVLAAVGIPH